MTAAKSRASPGPQRPLERATDELLRDPDTVAHWLSIADKYMQNYAQNPTAFILPREHKFLKPVIDSYAHNLEGFTHYLAGVRDSMPRKSLAWERTQSLYRRVMGRCVQQERRLRADRAIAKATELYGPIGFHERLKWIACLEHDWAKRRLEFLEKHRRRTENNRLSTDERTEFLLEFWDNIDTEIAEGKLPPWN